MRKSLYIGMVMCLLSGWTARAQRTVDLDFRQVTLNVVFDAIERQTGQPVYRQPLETDSMVVSVHSEKEEPLVALRRALEGTPFQVSSYGGAFFVLRDNTLMTSLPENFFLREKRREGDGDEEGSGISLMAGRKQQKATSENKVYEIGDASGKAADRVTVTGNISDFKTGEPMVGVAVFVKDPMIGATTDAYGYYTLRLPPGRHELYIQGMGMKDTRRQIMLYSDGKLDIELEEQVYTLKEVTISSEKIANVRNTTMGVERLKVKDIKNIPMAFGEVDIMKVVMSLPGVKAVGEASSGFNVRGGATDQNLILFNDGTVYNPTHLFGFFSVFNPDVVKDMELYKSSIPAKYGGRISSVLDINSREGNKRSSRDRRASAC